MAYIGKEPIVGNFQKCDAITVVNGQAAYTLQVSSTNVVPESANHMLVSLNGILQAPVTSFTVSGSTLTFASNLATGDVIDFVILLGNVLDLGTPSDGTVTNAKLASDLISGETDIGGAIADADLFLLDDGAGGTLRKTAASRLKTYVGSGLAEADQWRITASLSVSSGATSTIASNWERNDTTGFSVLGSGMTESSGIFTFPSTGYWLIEYVMNPITAGATVYMGGYISITTNNSSYANVTEGYTNGYTTNADGFLSASWIFDVTSTTDCKVKFLARAGAANANFQGATTLHKTGATFIKLGDT